MGETGTRFITIVPELGETSCSGVPVAAGRAGWRTGDVTLFLLRSSPSLFVRRYARAGRCCSNSAHGVTQAFRTRHLVGCSVRVAVGALVAAAAAAVHCVCVCVCVCVFMCVCVSCPFNTPPGQNVGIIFISLTTRSCHFVQSSPFWMPLKA